MLPPNRQPPRLLRRFSEQMGMIVQRKTSFQRKHSVSFVSKRGLTLLAVSFDSLPPAIEIEFHGITVKYTKEIDSSTVMRL